MKNIELKKVEFGGVTLHIPEIWKVETEKYKEPDGRECAMIEIEASEGDPRSIVISYGPMPEGSDSLMEASGTYEELIGEIGPAEEDDPICEYDFLGTTAFGFDAPTEDQMACNFMCAEVGFPAQLESGVGCRLFTILTTAQSYEDIDDLLDLIEENIYFK